MAKMPWTGDQQTPWGRSYQEILDQQQPYGDPGMIDLPWVDQLAQNILLTVQAFQRLHAAWNTKFPQ